MLRIYFLTPYVKLDSGIVKKIRRHVYSIDTDFLKPNTINDIT